MECIENLVKSTHQHIKFCIKKTYRMFIT